MSLGSPSPRSPLVLPLVFSSPLLADDLFLDSDPLPQVLTATRLTYACVDAGVMQQRLDNRPTTFVDNNYDERRVMYFSAELAF